MSIKVLQCFKNADNSSYVGGVSTIINAYFENIDEFKENGIDIELFDYKTNKNIKNSKLANVLYIFEQRKALRNRLKICNETNVLNIHTSREYLFLKDVYLAVMAKKMGVYTVLTVHVGDIETVFNRIGCLRKKCIKLINRYVDRLVCLSQCIRMQFINNGIAPEKCVVLDNFHYMTPVKTDSILERTSKIHLLFVGAIHREKGIIELIDALECLGNIDISLDICGKVTDKSLEPLFLEKIERLGNKVRLCGYVYGIEKRKLFERADILLLPSYHEGFPLVILEALASGCAIVSTKVGATKEILKDGENVLWVGVHSSSDIVSAVMQFYDNDKRLSAMKSNNKKLGEQFEIGNHIKKLSSIYKVICCADQGD